MVALRHDLGRAARAPATGDASPSPAVEGRLIVLESRSSGVREGASLAISPVTIIGRGPESQVRIDDKLVSAQHTRLRHRNGRWYIEDLQSTNGTLLNQRPLDGEQPVEYGDVIGVGDVRLKLAR